MKNINNKGIVNLISIFICIAILIILCCFINYLKNNKHYTTPLDPEVNPKEDGILNLSGFGVFFEKYNGYLKSSEIATKLEDITINYLPEIFTNIQNYTKEDIMKYYSENADIILEKLGIDNGEKFTNFIMSLKQTNIDMSSWYRLDIIKDTFTKITDKDDYSYVEYEVLFKNDEKIRFSLYLSEKENLTPTYIIDVINN